MTLVGEALTVGEACTAGALVGPLEGVLEGVLEGEGEGSADAVGVLEVGLAAATPAGLDVPQPTSSNMVKANGRRVLFMDHPELRLT